MTMSAKSDTFEQYAHVFVVRIWREPREIPGASPQWRGVIERMSGGERRYVKDVDEISAFIAPYLERMGINLGMRWRLRRWLGRLRLAFTSQR